MKERTGRLTLRKGEKLRHRSLVDKLFREGKSLYDFPLRLVWRHIDREALEANFRDFVPPRLDNMQMLVTVPKKKLKKAVDRVKMRRRIREAYRLNRLDLKSSVNALEDTGSLSMAFIYLHNGLLPYETIERKMKALLEKLRTQIEKKN